MIITPNDHNEWAKAGEATHGFFHHDVDFLLDSAKEYAKLGENEEFRYRAINDVNFVRDTLDFFTGGNYTDKDVGDVQEQMTTVVRELSQQLKNGKSPDLSELQSTLTIGGTEVTMAQLMDFQKVGRELKESFINVSGGALNNYNIQGFGEMGMAKAIGDYYGSDKGKIGEMFAAGIDRLYQKGMVRADKIFNESPTFSGNGPYKWTESEKAAQKVGLKNADLFSNLDTSSKESITKDFALKLSAMRSMVQGYCDKFGISDSHVGLAGATAGITSYFQSWMNKI